MPTIARTGALALWLLLASACGGASFSDNVFHDPEAQYRVGTLGPGWEQVEVAQNDLAWHNQNVGAFVQVNATCDPDQDVPLSVLTNHLLIGFTERNIESSDLVRLDGREALRSHVTASLDGVQRELLLYVLKKDDCTYDFALVAPPGESYAHAEPAFEHFVNGFTTEVR
jgi:hypothetical protein